MSIINYKDNEVNINMPIFEVRALGTTVEFTNKFAYAEDAYAASHASQKEMYRIMNGIKVRIQ